MEAPLFLLQGDVALDTDLLGLWQPRPVAAAFAATGEPPLVWRVALPEDLAAASAGIRRQQQALAATERGLATARQRLLRIDPARATPFGPADGLDAQLTGTLRALRDVTGPAASFGLLDQFRLPAGWEEEVAAYRSFVDRTLRLLRPTVVVETIHLGRPAARSTLDLDGDCRSILDDGSIDAARLHSASVGVVLDSRRALLQLLGQIGAGAAGVAARFALPGGPIMALPAAFRYIRAIVAQAQNLALPLASA